MNEYKIFELINDMLGKIAWPVTSLVALFALKNQIKDFLEAIKNKIADSQSVKISTKGIELEQKIGIAEGKVEVLENKLNNSSLAASQFPKPVVDMEDLLSRFYKIADDYNTINIADYQLRVARKTDLGRQMGVFIISNSIPKERILENLSEGALVGLAYAIIISPSKEDKNLVFKVYNKGQQYFTKYAFATALETLLLKDLVESSDFPTILKIIQYYLKRADPSLIRKLDKVTKLM